MLPGMRRRVSRRIPSRAIWCLRCVAEYAMLRPMNNFTDFCKWAGSQRRAASMLGVSDATVSRWAARGCVPSLVTAEHVERVSHGLFKWEHVIKPASTDQREAG